MPRSTPGAPALNDDNDDNDVGLGPEPCPPADRPLSDYSATDDPPGVLVYTHGCSMRIRLTVPAAEGLDALARCGWSGDASPTVWKPSKPNARTRRYVLRGSKWLDERPPKNKRLPLARLNPQWKTRIYSLAVEVQPGAVYLDIQVIRHDDVRKFCEEVLCLAPADYEIAYYRTMERFVVVPPHVAHRLAEGIGALPVEGQARQARKSWLVKDHEIPLTIRKRTKTNAHLVVYRIKRGATAAYKVELRLRGQPKDRKEFYPSDIDKLDAVLLDLVAKYQTPTQPKPARWEPRSFTTMVERGPFDQFARQLPWKAWRGTQISTALKGIVRKCNTPSLVRLVVGRGNSSVFSTRARIRSASSPPPPISPTFEGNAWKCVERDCFKVSRYVLVNQVGDREEPSPWRPRDPWTAIATDIQRSKLYLHEVILDPQQSPRDLLQALAGGSLGRVGVAALCAVDASGRPDTWQSVIEATHRFPVGEAPIDTLIIPIDVTAVFDIYSAIVGGEEPSFGPDGDLVGDLDNLLQDGPLAPPANHVGMDPTHKAMGAWLFDTFEELRSLGERTGLRVVVVTCDERPDHGRAPGLLKSHYFHDSRVRSFIGDAGRYHCHQRYLVETVVTARAWPKYTAISEDTTEDGETIFEEYAAMTEFDRAPGNVILLKDEAEGLGAGRIVYRAPVSSSRPRWRRKKSLSRSVKVKG